jgi:hypothetical protein
MIKVLLTIVFSILIQVVYSQLDPMYHGTYFSEDLTSSFTLYALDETSEHCFFVDYEEYQDLEKYVNYSGNGHCDDSEGMKAEFYFMEFKGTIYARFEHADEGSLLMYVKRPGSTDEKLYIHAGHMDDLYEEEVSMADEIIFSREDGATFLLFDSEGQIGFTLTGNPNCEPNTITGLLMPEDEEMTVLNFEQDGCKIQVLGTENGVQITEANCAKFHEKCSAWEGFYRIK